MNNPVNHRDPFNRYDPAGTPDSVNLTFGLNFGIRNTAMLTAAFVTPVASPKPFDSEAIVMLNIFYGRTRQTVRDHASAAVISERSAFGLGIDGGPAPVAAPDASMWPPRVVIRGRHSGAGPMRDLGHLG